MEYLKSIPKKIQYSFNLQICCKYYISNYVKYYSNIWQSSSDINN
jgi:hypothetical protein